MTICSTKILQSKFLNEKFCCKNENFHFKKKKKMTGLTKRKICIKFKRKQTILKHNQLTAFEKKVLLRYCEETFNILSQKL